MVDWIYNNFIYFATGLFFLLITASMADNTFFFEDRENILKDYLAKEYRNHPSNHPLLLYTLSYVFAFICLFYLNSPQKLVAYCIVQLINFALYNLALEMKIKYKTCDIMCLISNTIMMVYLIVATLI